MSPNASKAGLLEWVEYKMGDLSDRQRLIFDHAETAWREYRSSTCQGDLLAAAINEFDEPTGGGREEWIPTWRYFRGSRASGRCATALSA